MSAAYGIAGMVDRFDPLALDAALWEHWLSQHAARTHALIEREKLLPMALLGDPNAWQWQRLWSDDGVVAPCAWRERKEPHCRCPRCVHQEKELLALRSGPCDCDEREAKRRAERQRLRQETQRSVREWWATTQDLQRMRAWLACGEWSAFGPACAHYPHYRLAPPVHHARVELAAWARSADELRSFLPDPGIEWVDPEGVPRDAVASVDADRIIYTAQWWMLARDPAPEPEEIRAARALLSERRRQWERQWKREQDEQRRRAEQESEDDDG